MTDEAKDRRFGRQRRRRGAGLRRLQARGEQADRHPGDPRLPRTALADAIERKEAFDRELAEALGEEGHAELVRLLKESLPIVTALERGGG